MGKWIKERNSGKFPKVRGHHLLCLMNFHGLGYNKEFISNFKELLDKLSSHLMVLTAECDDICFSCPYREGSKCVKKADEELRLKEKDKKLLRRLDLELGAQISIHEARRRIKQRLSLSEVLKFCRDCEWLEGVCAEGFRKVWR